MRILPTLRLASGLAVLVAILSCAAPGVDISPQPGDFAFLEVALQG
ncbi:MAG: hypothetical protein ACYTG2_17775 [Planctomycetota bacterium]|jgi:hypothetical protein